jgi:adenine deaminase
MYNQLVRISAMSEVDAMHPYRFSFLGAKGYFKKEDVGSFAEGFDAGTFTFVPPLKNIGAIKVLKSGTFIAIRVEPIE